MSIERLSDEELERRFLTRGANEALAAPLRRDRLANAMLDAAIAVRDLTAPSYEQRLAITRLEEALAWAFSALARERTDFVKQYTSSARLEPKKEPPSEERPFVQSGLEELG